MWDKETALLVGRRVLSRVTLLVKQKLKLDCRFRRPTNNLRTLDPPYVNNPG